MSGPRGASPICIPSVFWLGFAFCGPFVPLVSCVFSVPAKRQPCLSNRVHRHALVRRVLIHGRRQTCPPAHCESAVAARLRIHVPGCRRMCEEQGDWAAGWGPTLNVALPIVADEPSGRLSDMAQGNLPTCSSWNTYETSTTHPERLRRAVGERKICLSITIDRSSTACYQNSTRRRALDRAERSQAVDPGKSQKD